MTHLSVPHFTQEHPTSCVSAAVRMALAFLGIERTELQIRNVLEWDDEGTRVLNIDLIEESNLEVLVESDVMDVNSIRRTLDAGVPMIVGVWTAALPYWSRDRPHAVVVIGYDDDSVYLNDPKFPDAPKVVDWEPFIEAWESFGRFGAVIRRRS